MGSRRAVVATVATSALALAVGAAIALPGLRAPRRDEAAFYGYVTRTPASDYGVLVGETDPHQWEYDWAAEHPDVVVAEGDAACRWLASRPDAPGDDPVDASSVHEMVGVYLAETDQPGIAAFSDLGRRTVVTGAWALLCPDTRADKTVLADDDGD